MTRIQGLVCSVLLCCAGAEAQSADVHLLVVSQGAVTLKRLGWTASTPAASGTPLRRGDLVQVPPLGKATVACADLTLHELAPGRFSGVPCVAAERTALVYEGSLLTPTRADATDQVPVVIAPRRTKLLGPRPTLRWTPVRGVARYTVSLRGSGVQWSVEHASPETRLVYPADAPALVPGASYKLTVVAAGRSSDENNEPGLGFTLVGAEAAQAITATAQRIRALALPPEAQRLLLAHHLASNGLLAEAIEQIEAEAPPARVALVLASLYQAVGLHRVAEARYVQAAQQALAAADLEAQLLAQQALGRIYLDALGLKSEAARALSEALTLARRLGDAKTAEQLEAGLADARRP